MPSRRSLRCPAQLRIEFLEDRRTPATINISPVLAPSALSNDFTVIQNAVNAANDGDTIVLDGIFNFAEPNAAASWANGSDTLDPFDNYSVYVPDGLTGVTLTSSSLGSAVIQGPGDLPDVDLESFLYFEGSSYQGWTISNLDIRDFDIAIGMFGDDEGAFDNATITNNRIRISADANGEDNPDDQSDNYGIHYGAGLNQTISGNLIEIPGNGISGPTAVESDLFTNPEKFATSIGIISDTFGATAYDGLAITGNTIRVLGAQSARPERVIGIWENGNAHNSDITISGNLFLNASADNSADLNRQQAFWVTSHSNAAAGTTVSYNNNQVTGASVGFLFVEGLDFRADPTNTAVEFSLNTLSGVRNGLLVQSNGLALLSGNDFAGTGASSNDGFGVRVAFGSHADSYTQFGGDKISGFAIGFQVESTGRISGATITGNTIGILADEGYVLVEQTDLRNNLTAGLQVQNDGLVDAGQLTAPLDFTGLGISVGGNNFAGGYSAGGAQAIVNANTGADFAGNGSNGPTLDLQAQGNFFSTETPAFLESVILHDADDSSRGFVNASASPFNDVSVTAEFVTPEAFVGQYLTLLVKVTNLGSSPATNVVTQTALPPGADFIGAESSQGSVSQIGAVVNAFIGTLAPGATATVRITIEPTVIGELSASTVAILNETDSIPANNVAAAAVDVTNAMGGIVTVKRVGGQLMINGDASTNGVQIVAGSAANSFRVIGLAGTQIQFNGVTGPTADVTGVTKGVTSALGGGDNTLIVDGSGSNDQLNFSGSLTVRPTIGNDSLYVLHVDALGLSANGGAGNDRSVVAESAFRRNLAWSGVSGDDSLSVIDSDIDGSLNANGGSGSDRLDISGTAIGKSLVWTGGSEDDVFNLNTSTIAGATTLRGGPGLDLMTIASSAFNGTFAWIGQGESDTLQIQASSFAKKFSAVGAAGDESIDIAQSSFASRAIFNGGAGVDALDAGTGSNPTGSSRGNTFAVAPTITGFEDLLS